jgi:predicted nucleic acid-binding protein
LSRFNFAPKKGYDMAKVCVVDASVVLKWFLREPDSASADILLEKLLNDELELLAPDLILLETASALWKRVIIRKEMSAKEAALIHRDLLTLPLSLIASGTMVDAVLRIALEHKHSVYDSLYCALAIERDCDFVTADRVLANKLQTVFPFIVHISAVKP